MEQVPVYSDTALCDIPSVIKRFEPVDLHIQ